MKKILGLFLLLALIACEQEAEKNFDDYGPAEYLWERWTYPNEEFHEKKFDAVD